MHDNLRKPDHLWHDIVCSDLQKKLTICGRNRKPRWIVRVDICTNVRECSGIWWCLFRASRVLKLTHIRLDRESITAIDNLDCLGPITNLYLQQVGGVYANCNQCVDQDGWCSVMIVLCWSFNKFCFLDFCLSRIWSQNWKILILSSTLGKHSIRFTFIVLVDSVGFKMAHHLSCMHFCTYVHYIRWNIYEE